ncbi:class I SAM-dependent methyltransferase [Candidatus Omnitrophota bacterium]
MNISHKCKEVLKQVFPGLYSRWVYQKQYWLSRKIDRVLSKPQDLKYYDSEELFEHLQDRYLPLPEYGFDSWSTWKRGTKRASVLMESLEVLRKPELRMLEVGCGDGMTGYAFVNYGHDVSLIDIDDWRDKRASNIDFVRSDVCSRLPFDSDSFDIAYSFNTFEHLGNPEAALRELVSHRLLHTFHHK